MKSLLLLLSLILVACSPKPDTMNALNADYSNNWVEHQIEVPSFLLTSFERINVTSAVANIYIEGDGRAWLNKRIPSLDPTPNNPVAFNLAQLDSADNVFYLARPCQYTKMIDGSACEQKYWTSHRFSVEVIDAIDDALDDIKRRSQITGFNLVGFSGGGNVAALLAARRNDVLSIRTVAGNLDHSLQSNMHNVSQMPYSLNAKNVAKSIEHIPQLHFVGGKDKIVPQKIYESYKSASDQSDCVKLKFVDTASHTDGWESVWKSLLSMPVDCSKP